MISFDQPHKNLLQNKKILISPNTPLTKTFAAYLKSKGFNIVGFLDKNKIGSDIYNLKQVSSIDFDFVLIYNKLFFKEIYKELREEIDSKLIYQVRMKGSDYLFYNSQQIFINKLKHIVVNYKHNFYHLIQKLLSKTCDRLNKKRSTIVFLAKDSTGANLKYLYLYFHNQNPSSSIIVTQNKEELKELKKYNFNCLMYHSLRSYIVIAMAKTVIVEQVIMDYFDSLSPKQKSVQLWHGISLKKLYPSRVISYDYFMATSQWLNEVTFKNIFQAKQFLTCGYSRNDVFFNKITTKELLFCDKQIYSDIKINYKNKRRTIIYLPTYREDKTDNIPPIDFKQLNTRMGEINAIFIIKLHPFALEKFNSIIDTDVNYSNLIFYKTQGDIYPILKYTDLLITDYSSIAFDYLLLDRPILYFDYDYKKYIDSRGEFLLDYNEYTPGVKVKTQEHLFKEIENSLNGIDTYKEARTKLVEKLFEYKDGNSSRRIANFIS